MIKADTTEPTRTATATECSGQALLFPELTSKPVVVLDFEAGHVSSDGGGVLLARLDRSYGYTQRFAQCFHDHRRPDLIEHELLSLLRQRTYGVALGYEDLTMTMTGCAPIRFWPACAASKTRWGKIGCASRIGVRKWVNP